MKKVDFLIVGQGIAGSIFAHRLLAKKQKIHVIDIGSGHSASRQATGLINPITGRRFVKSWMIDELFPCALKLYRELETLLERQFVSQTKVYRVIQSIEQLNDVGIRLQDENYADYLQEELIRLNSSIKQEHPSLIIDPVLQIDIIALQNAFQAYFSANDWIENKQFEFSKLHFGENTYTYQNIEAKQVVFCEGHQVRNNPFFNYLPHQIAKGEALIIHCPDLLLDGILNSKVNISPIGNDQYYVGSTYDWNDDQQVPTQAKKEFLLKGLTESILADFTLVDQKVGIRPTMKDRRPVLGEHPKHKGMYVFNGMGTKGLSLVPYFSIELIKNIFENKSLHPEVDIKRFK